MKQKDKKKDGGFSLVELLIALTIMLMLLAVASTLFSRAITSGEREIRRADALASSQAALNVISREVANSGYGMIIGHDSSNGLVISDCNEKKIRVRANITNNNLTTSEPGEDVTYFYDAATESIVRYDPNDTPQTSVVVNRISNVTFTYFDYSGSSSTPILRTVPTANTGRVTISVVAQLENIEGQPDGQTARFTSDVTLRNSKYMLNQY